MACDEAPEALREKVARAMLATPLDGHYPPVPWEDASDEARDAYLMEADAAVNVVLEEVAAMIERQHGYGTSRQIAKEVRAMKGNSNDHHR